MTEIYISKVIKNTFVLSNTIFLCLLLTPLIFSQNQDSDVPLLLANQTVERQVKGPETHRYRFNLKENEFLQVRIEQKGIDIGLKLLDVKGQALASMDSPNGTEGFETLSFVATASGSFILEVSSLNAKAEKGVYLIRRGKSSSATMKDKKRVVIEHLFVEGMIARATAGEAEKAVLKFSEALSGWQELADRYMEQLTAPLVLQSKGRAIFIEARNLFEQGLPESYKKALSKFQEANQFYMKGNDKNDAAIAYMGAAIAAFYLGEKEFSLKFFNQALQLFREIGKRETEAAVLYSIGQVYTDLGLINKALDNYSQALVIQREIGNKDEEATLLLVSGVAYNDLGEKQKALEYLNRAKVIFELMGNKKNQSAVLNAIGSAYYTLGDKQIAIESFLQALDIERENKYVSEEAITLNNIGKVYEDLGAQEKALAYYKQALILFKELNDKNGDAITLNNLAAIYSTLGDKEKALTYYTQTLFLYKEVNNLFGQSGTLNKIGLIYSELGERQKALEYFNLSLTLSRQTSNKNDEAAALGNIGLVNFDAGQMQTAVDFFNQALRVQKATGDTKGEAVTFSNIGKVYDSLGDAVKAKMYFQEALALNTVLRNPTTTNIRPENQLKPVKTELKEVSRVDEEAQKSLIIYLRQVEMSRQFGVKSTEATALTELMFITRALDNPLLAISYGKQAVNVYQQLRLEIKGGNIKIQNALLRSFEDAYRILADLLIEQGRISEAEQVLTMLKEEETFSYLRRDDRVAKDLLQTVLLNDAERAALLRYNEFADKITSTGQEFGELDIERRKYSAGRFPKQARYNELKKQLADATVAFQKFLNELKAKFGQRDERVAAIDSSVQNTLKRLSAEHTAVVSIIVGEDRLNIIVTTSVTQRAHTIDIAEKDLNLLAADFRRALTDPKIDPRPAGQKLYDLLVKPIESDLAGIKADTILWSLDGTLRYLPTAAIWDAKQGYLAEHFASAVLTLASRDTIGLPVEGRQNWQAFGAGISKPTEGFTALAAVPDELDCIITDTSAKTVSLRPVCPSGVMNGRKLLDEKFTLQAFEDALGRFQVVHLASHFQLNPGSDKDSFLLLGGGEEKHFTVENLREDLLADVELLVLSACNTATPGGEKANGIEIEGFGAVAQKQGAKAVMATLWSVADNSTRDLMVNFYRLYKQNQISKAEAMRRAQLMMIYGTNKLDGRNTVRGTEIINQTGNNKTQIPFKTDENAPFAHPFYWSPFVLYGNWR